MSLSLEKWMKGKTFTTVGIGDKEITLYTRDGSVVKLYHNQQRSENVRIVCVDGHISNLISTPILDVVETIKCNDINILPNHLKEFCKSDSFTWTHYEFVTAKGTVKVDWLGESTGYYSESVDYDITVPGP